MSRSVLLSSFCLRCSHESAWRAPLSSRMAEPTLVSLHLSSSRRLHHIHPRMRFQSTGIFGQCCSRRCSSNRSEILPTQRPGPSRTRSLMPQSPMPCLPSRILFRSDAGDPIEAVLDAPPEQAAHTDGAGSYGQTSEVVPEQGPAPSRTSSRGSQSDAKHICVAEDVMPAMDRAPLEWDEAKAD